MEPDDVLDQCWEHIQYATSFKDICNIRLAGRYAWEQKEMGGLEHVQFAHRNNTPIVPIGHCCHPLELIKRGFIDGEGWPKGNKSALERVKYFKWPDGNHWYASFDGRDITAGSSVKWNSQEDAMAAAKKWVDKYASQ